MEVKGCGSVYGVSMRKVGKTEIKFEFSRLKSRKSVKVARFACILSPNCHVSTIISGGELTRFVTLSGKWQRRATF